MSLLRKLAQSAAKTYPFARESLQVALIMGGGDILAQTVAEKKNLTSIDWVRTGKFAGLGLVIVAPSLRVWYGTLERRIAQNQPRLKRTLKKVAFDQCCFAPVFTAFVTTCVNLMNGMSLQENRKSLEQKYVPIMKVNYMVWPAAQILNFGFLPLQYQVVFAQLVGLIWNMFLSLKINEEIDAKIDN